MEKMDPLSEIKDYLEGYMRKQDQADKTDSSVVDRLKNRTTYPLSRDDAVPLIDEPMEQTIAAGGNGEYKYPLMGNVGNSWSHLNALLANKTAYITPRVEINFVPEMAGESGIVRLHLLHGTTSLANKSATFNSSYTTQFNTNSGDSRPDLILTATPSTPSQRLGSLTNELNIRVEAVSSAIVVRNIKLIPEIRADGYRINANPRIQPYQPNRKENLNLELVKQGETQIIFFEYRGNKNPYYGAVNSLFVFRIYAHPLPDARKLWSILDCALHDKNRVKFSDLNVYYSLRSALPEMDLEAEELVKGASDFLSVYEIAYWEYENERA